MDNPTEKIVTPTLMVDTSKCLSNIDSMWSKARRSGTSLRPHFKTHQSIEIGKWFREKGVDGISVSSMDMAVFFAGGGFDDISVCVPINIREIDRINGLARDIRLNCLVESVEVAGFLSRKLESDLGVFIEIDCGYGRTGVSNADHLMIIEILSNLETCPNIDFKGFLTHAGHSYQAESVKQIEQIHLDTVQKMAELKTRFAVDYPDLIISIGDTPCCSVAEDLDGIDEARPGNFVFHDLTQVRLGSCKPQQIAVAMACPVIARYPTRGEVVIHGGSVHLGKESLVTRDGSLTYGEVVEFNSNGWGDPLPGVNVRSLSQEQGIISGPVDFVRRIHIGDILGILPVHSCITADTAGGYVTLDGQVLDHMRGRSRG
ncbi:alanine racemase [Gemmatimonadota bacterium]